MCQMYAIFEEVVGPQPAVTFSASKDSQNPEDEDQGIVVTSADQQSAADPENSDTSSQYAVGRTRPKRSPSKQRVYGSSSYHHRHSSTLPRSSRRRLPPSSTAISNDSEDTSSSTSSSNPLLETISVLAYDPPDDSDDYYDLTSVVYGQCRGTTKGDGEKHGKTSGGVASATEGDRDSVGYAGSSSIDSGYKSFCPTPEIPDSSVYGPEDLCNRTHPYSGFYADSSSVSQGRSSKPRIMMGTKVINRQGHVSPSPLRESPVSRRSDSSLYDVNLDHLMYLRQSLLSAIQKCESSKSDSNPSVKQNRRDNLQTDKYVNANPVEDQRYTDNSPVKCAQPSYQKTVRFNTDVKVSTVNSSQPASESSDANPCRTADSSGEPNKIQSKSILKDPLCANLRSQLEAGSSDCTLEEEIDSLLYGRAEFYDLESVDDFPCSYVTMIEEKYRSGKPSIAKVRRLKGSKVLEQPTKSGQTSDCGTTSSNGVSPEEDSRQQKSSKETSASTLSISKTAKCRFTEVARCMLEIIEDLQMKKLQPEAGKEGVSSPTENQKLEPSSEDTISDSSAIADAKSNSECYTTAAEYHVYEEIAYDFLTNGTIPVPPKRQEMPPPLPARPTIMFSKLEQQGTHQERCRVPSPPPRKGRCSLRRNLQQTSDSSEEVRNRPKQRGNLYCLFADRAERRNISRSLEREWRVTGNSDNQDDDYGFKKEFPSI